MTEKNMAKADFYTSIVLMAFGIAAVVMALGMPVISTKYSAPGVLPIFLGVIITGLSFIMFIRSIVRLKGHVGVSVSSIKDALAAVGSRRMIVTIFLCLCYSLLLGKVLFPALTFLFIFAFIAFFEFDRKLPLKQRMKIILIAALVAVLASAAVTSLFRYLFLVRLP